MEGVAIVYDKSVHEFVYYIFILHASSRGLLCKTDGGISRWRKHRPEN